MANDGAARRGGSNDNANHLRPATAAHPPYSCATLECSADELQTAILVSRFLSLGKEYCFGNKKSMRKLTKESGGNWVKTVAGGNLREPGNNHMTMTNDVPMPLEIKAIHDVPMSNNEEI